MWPWASSILAARRSTPVGSVTSTMWARTVPPSSSMARRVRSARPASTSAISPKAPCWAKRAEMAPPIPSPPPVTTATLPSRSLLQSSMGATSEGRCALTVEAARLRMRWGPQAKSATDGGDAVGIGEGKAEDHLIGAGFDVTGHKIGDFVRLTDDESGGFLVQCYGGHHGPHLGRVLVGGGQDQGAHPGDSDLSGVTPDVGAVPVEHVDLVGQLTGIAGDIALVGVEGHQP